MKVVLVGATGAVGTEVLSILEEREFPLDELIPVASPRSAGRKLDFRNGTVEVVAISPEVFEGADIALFDLPDDVTKKWAPIAAERGAIVVDNSGAWRMDRDVPLVVPEVNPGAVSHRPRNIIASPNCTTLAMVVPLAALHRRYGVRRLILASYQAASGSGMSGIDELWDQTEVVAKDPEKTRAGLARELLEAGPTFSHPIAMNVIPHCGSVKEDGYTSEELKLLHETRKIMDLPGLEVTATCVRVPVMVGHGVAVHAEFDEVVDVAEARNILKSSDGVELADDLEAGLYPTPLDAAGRDSCYVGRIRRDLFDDHALEMFCVADNLRKGAALNTVQVAELLAKEL
ncbi:MAG: aspartate-semialdehyde dehydrogenase [Actinomycetota bacterium]|jgi:aspartate-semialdehyde dehydrogenase|nr:aspartate-semialdehyde dehydrogenase [Actinomycetota bacterium]